MGLVASSTIARVMGIAIMHSQIPSGEAPLLPQRIAVFAQGATSKTYSTEPFSPTNAVEVGDRMGYGGVAHLIAKFGLFPDDGAGVNGPAVTIYPLVDDGAGDAAEGSITTVGTTAIAQNVRVKVNNILSAAIAIPASTAPAAVPALLKPGIDAVLEMPITCALDSATLDVTCKWKGATGNALYIEVVDADDPTKPPKDTTVTWTITQPTGGATNPSLAPAIEAKGEVWETIIVNSLNIEDSLALDALQTAGEAAWNAPYPKPFVAIATNTIVDVTSATSVANARTLDRINCLPTVPGSRDLPFISTARLAVEVANLANENPPHDYGGRLATGLRGGTNAQAWNHAKRQLANSRGGSTVEISDRQVRIADMITCYKPAGDPNPAYRYVVDIVRLQNAAYNFALRFLSPEWDGAPLVDDDQPVTNPTAKKARDAITEIHSGLDELGRAAILTSIRYAKTTAKARIAGNNNKRIDWEVVCPLSGNANIRAGILRFSVGGAPAAAA